MKKYIFILFCFFICTLFSCATTKQDTNIVNSSIDKGEAEAESLQEIQKEVLNNISDIKDSNNYILQSGDLVEIKVFMENNMDRTLRISSNGTITFPLVGNIKIGGYSVYAAEEKVSEINNQRGRSPLAFIST